MYRKWEEYLPSTKVRNQTNNNLAPHDAYVERFNTAEQQAPAHRRNDSQPVELTIDLTLPMIRTLNEHQVDERNQELTPFRPTSRLDYSSTDSKSTPSTAKDLALQQYLDPGSDETLNIQPFRPDASPSETRFRIENISNDTHPKDLTAAEEDVLYTINKLINYINCDLKTESDNEQLLDDDV